MRFRSRIWPLPARAAAVFVAGLFVSVLAGSRTSVDGVVASMAAFESASRKIAEINRTLDGIAFQIHILALNAAVEAAWAGEQACGFSVVARHKRPSRPER